MPKETKKESKRKSHVTPSNEKTPYDFCSNAINTFIKQHNNDLNTKHAQLVHLTEQCEQIKFVDTCKKLTFDDLQKSFTIKSNALDEMTAKYEKLRYDCQILHTNLVAQNKKYVELEVSYSEKNRSLSDQLKRANDQISSMDIVLSAKEAECAAYLKDIRIQLEELHSENIQLEKQISDLRNSKTTIENLLESNKQEAIVEKQNLISKHEKEVARKRKKITKKEKRIHALVKIVNTLESEKKELQKALEMEGYKIRDLQRVLNRPISCASPIKGKEIEQSPTIQVEEVMPLNESSSLSSNAPTPVTEINVNIRQEPNKNIPKRSYGHKRPFQQNSSDNNEVVNTNIGENEQQEIGSVSFSECEVNMHKIQQQLDKWNQTQVENRPPSQKSGSSLRMASNDDSDDLILPYRPKQALVGKANGENKSHFKGAKRFKK